MKSFVVCLIVAGILTLTLEGLLGNPAAPAPVTASKLPVALQDCGKLEGQPQSFQACSDLQQRLTPSTTQDKPSSSGYSSGY